MLEMLTTIAIVLLIIIVIALIISIFANITLGTPTPINALVRPISNKIGKITDERAFVKTAADYENRKVKNVKTYELEKEKEHEKEVEKEHHKPTHTHERTISHEPEMDKSEEKTKTLKK